MSIAKNDLCFLVTYSQLRLTYLILRRGCDCDQGLENSKSIHKV